MSNNTLDLEHYRNKIIALKKTLEAAQTRGHADTQPVLLDQSSVGRLSRMDAMQMQAMSLEASRRRALQLQRVSGALQRLDKGNYGICLKCDEPIPPKRLDFDPTAFLCIDCAQASESR